MKNWMQHLADHYETLRLRHPDDELLVLFDIDGTILDIRYTLHCLLTSYDEEFGTNYFDELQINDITFHEEDIHDGLKSLHIPSHAIHDVLCWYRENRWSMWSVLEANSPFPGVMEVIRWFQLQDNTSVGLNTGRSEVLREDTLQSLNSLGQEFRVVFNDDLLKMRRGCHATVADAKVDAIREYRATGYRVIAMIDNEPANLQAIEDSDHADDILLLQASMIFNSQRHNKTVKTIQGNVYDLTELIPRRLLPGHIQFVWNHVNTEVSLDNFMRSNVRWADVTGAITGFVSNRPQSVLPDKSAGDRAGLQDYIAGFRDQGRGMRICLHPQYDRMEMLLDELVESGIPGDTLWLSGNIDTIRRDMFRLISDIFPGATIECPIDFIVPVLLSTPDKAEQILDTYAVWGINRFALGWKTPNTKKALSVLEDLGFETTIYDVKTLEEFLQAVLYTPAAIVSDFNFPLWNSRERELPREALAFTVNA